MTPKRPRAPKASRRAAEPARRAWGTISREEVIQAALRVVHHAGFDELTIRSVATGLGAAPMSLYHHVKDKDDLVGEVVDRLLAKAWRPRVDEADWRRWTVEAADRLRRFLATQPAALHVYLRNPVVSPTAMLRMAEMIRVLEGAGVEEDVAHRAYAAIHTYTIGFAALESARAQFSLHETASDKDTRRLASYTSPRQFTEGLGYILEGFSTTVALA